MNGREFEGTAAESLKNETVRSRSGLAMCSLRYGKLGSTSLPFRLSQDESAEGRSMYLFRMSAIGRGGTASRLLTQAADRRHQEPDVCATLDWLVDAGGQLQVFLYGFLGFPEFPLS